MKGIVTKGCPIEKEWINNDCSKVIPCETCVVFYSIMYYAPMEYDSEKAQTRFIKMLLNKKQGMTLKILDNKRTKKQNGGTT